MCQCTCIWRRRDYHLPTFPRLSTSGIGIKIGYDSHNKQCYGPNEGSEVVSTDREENKESGGGILILADPWSQTVHFLQFLGLILKYNKGISK